MPFVLANSQSKGLPAGAVFETAVIHGRFHRVTIVARSGVESPVFSRGGVVFLCEEIADIFGGARVIFKMLCARPLPGMPHGGGIGVCHQVADIEPGIAGVRNRGIEKVEVPDAHAFEIGENVLDRDAFFVAAGEAEKVEKYFAAVAGCFRVT